jgi:hypothetical protein
LRPVGEEPSSVDEAQATALEFGARFSNLMVKMRNMGCMQQTMGQRVEASKDIDIPWL